MRAAGRRRRGARHRLRLERRLAGDRARRAAPRCSRSRRREFGHGRTRNLGAERTSGRADLLPHAGRDAAARAGSPRYEEAFALADDVGAAFGPHLPRPDTSPMIARELTEFFAGFSPDGGRARPGADDPMFLSNVNACYRRDCWEQIRFHDVPYSEDQAFARALRAARLAAGLPPAARPCCTRTTTRRSDFMRRYFDEYRGPARDERPRRADRRALDASATSAGSSAPTGAGCASRAGPRAERARWTGRSAAAPHQPQGVRRRSARARTGCRPPVQRAISLEGRATARRRAPRRPKPPVRAARARRRTSTRPSRELAREGAAPLLDAGARAWPTREQPAHRGRDPAVPARQRRPLDDLQPALAARGARATRSRPGCTTRSAATRASGRR